MKKLLLGILAGVVVLALLGTATAYFRPDLAYSASMSMERSLAGLSVKSVAVEGLNWTYMEGGNGPTLVLVHGFSADKDNWVRIARHLNHRFHLVVPDLIGFGDSDRPMDRGYSPAEQARRLGAFLDALGIEKAHFGGSSMGGYILGALAHDHPDRVQSLWLMAPAGVLTAPHSEMIQRILAGEGNPLIPESPEDFAFTLEFIFSNPPFIPPPVKSYLGQRQIQRQAGLDHIFGFMERADTGLETYLQGYQAPVLVVWGQEDRVLHPQGATILGRLLPQAEVEMMPATGHLPMLEHPEATARRYLAFQPDS